MNLRIFESDDDLKKALHRSLLRVVENALSPHIGIVGLPHETSWLLEELRGNRRVRVAGHPHDLDEMIARSSELSAARAADLSEPLDLCVLLGSKHGSFPMWYENARAKWISPLDRRSFETWQAADTGPDGWFFILENHISRSADRDRGDAQKDSTTE